MSAAAILNQTRQAGIIVLSVLFLSMISASAVSAGTIGDNINKGIEESAGTSQKDTTLFGNEGEGGLLRTITNVLLFITGAAAVIALVFGGLRYVVSGGDQEGLAKAKQTIIYAIIGLVVSFLGFAVVNFVADSITDTNTTTTPDPDSNPM